MFSPLLPLSHRSCPFRQVAEHVVLLSPRARSVLAVSRQGHDPVPGARFAAADLLRMLWNSSVFTVLAYRFRRIGQMCTEDRAIREFSVTGADWKGNHRSLRRSTMLALRGSCLAKMGKGSADASMMDVARYYTEEVLLMEDMAEVVDDSCVPILESQFLLNGS
jgi:hypothetical protein